VVETDEAMSGRPKLVITMMKQQLKEQNADFCGRQVEKVIP